MAASTPYNFEFISAQNALKGVYQRKLALLEEALMTANRSGDSTAITNAQNAITNLMTAYSTVVTDLTALSAYL
jgi:hypothetical protein